MPFVPSRLRTFPAPKKFVPFEEFLQVVRPLEISCSHGYMKWTSSAGRPQDIPSRPDLAYAGKGWVSWPHALGRSALPRGRERKHDPLLAAELYAQHQRRVYGEAENASEMSTHAKRQTNSRAATSWFLDVASQHLRQEFEFYRLSERARANVVFRKRGDTFDSWRGIRVKSTSGVFKTQYCFRFRRPYSDVAGAFACLPEKSYALLLPEDVGTICTGGNVRLQELPFAQGPTGDVGLLQFLMQLRDAVPGSSIASFGGDDRLALHEELVSQASQLLYEPLGLQMQRRVHRWCNGMLGRLRVHQRAVCYIDVAPKARLSKRVRVGSGEWVHLYLDAAEEDAPHLYLYFVHDKKMRLTGVFAFPAVFLEEEGYIRSAMRSSRGVSWIHLYPPGSVPKLHCAALAGRQREYYVDLTIDLGGGNDAHVREFEKIIRSIERSVGIQLGPACTPESPALSIPL